MQGSRLRSSNLAAFRSTCVAAILLAASGVAVAQDPNACDAPGDFPDLALGELHSVALWGPLDGIFAYSIGASTCNLGTCWANWLFDSDQHPVFGENLFRLEAGRFEQIGQSWVTHRFFALSQTLCERGCLPTNGQHLGVDCSTTDTAAITGGQQYKGPKSEVNPSNGSYVFPFTGSGETGNHIYKRLQVRQQDLEPGSNPDALYFIEGQSVTEDDAAAGMQHNNASWRQVLVAPATLNLLPTGATAQEQPAIHAWAEFDPEVALEAVDVPHDGRFFVASKATSLGDGNWHYEYAIHNLNSHRSAMSVVLPIPHEATVTNVGFHDVDYHSGEPYDGTDWTASLDTESDPPALTWTTQSFAENPNANALRWGTLYNFRFDADVPPAPDGVELSIGLFRPGSPQQISAPAAGPDPCDLDSICEPGESPCNCAGDCGAPREVESSCSDGQDDDCDGSIDCADAECCGDVLCPLDDVDADSHLACEDCNDDDGAIWSTPGAATGVLLDRDDQARSILHWDAPADPGGLLLEYETIRSTDAADFLTTGECLPVIDPTATTSVDPGVPPSASVFYYLVRATNTCPLGTGPVGGASDGSERPTLVCD